MKLKVVVVEQKEAARWGVEGARPIFFDDATELIHDLQNGLFELRKKEAQTGGQFYLLLID